MNVIENFLQEHTIRSHKRDDITIIEVASFTEGIAISQKLLSGLADRKTVLFLSGGKTPRVLYKQLATNEGFCPGAVGIIDERFGTKFHKDSNELMLQESGLLRSLSLREIPFYPILLSHSEQSEESLAHASFHIRGRSLDFARDDMAEAYDQTVRGLFAQYPKSIGFMGIGADGHTAGILPNAKLKVQSSKFDSELVASYESDDQFRERITMTFLGLAMQDLLLVLAMGREKETALNAMLSDGSEEQIPARFYRRPDIAKKTIVITDQKI